MDPLRIGVVHVHDCIGLKGDGGAAAVFFVFNVNPCLHCCGK